ncbi:MAG TPA: HAMP domain-containing sensor histidine kinase [Acidimicrobiales bacterium]|nr:HAMP domain-containing sensor histidine kinase [Acidimicrobiales bacterium]
MQTTIRLRLTLLYGGLFVVAGAVLLTLNYAMVRSNLPVDDVVFTSTAPRELFPGPGRELAPDAFDGSLGGGTGRVLINGEQVPVEELRNLPGEVRDQALHQLLVQSGTALGLMAVVSVALGWVVAGRVLQPLHDITATAKRLSEQNLDQRIALTGPSDELKELADTFDAMLARLDAAFDSQRRFVANASHELRTPLTIMRTEIDVTLADPDAGPDDLRSMARTVSYAVARCERLIDSLLVLARSERAVGDPLPVDLAEATRSAVAQLAGEADAGGLRVDATLDPAPVEGNPALVEQLAYNLVDNAVRYNTAGGWIHVTTGVADGKALLRVANSGPVLSDEDATSLFEPFRRAGRDRTGPATRGAGLGLSIVRSVVTAHGGRVSARPFRDGGLEMTVLLPSPASLAPGHSAPVESKPAGPAPAGSAAGPAPAPPS